MDIVFDHCEGTLVVHVEGGLAECTEPDCVDFDQLRHLLLVDCTALSGGCFCTGSRELARVS
jgi:hypothetical protein